VPALQFDRLRIEMVGESEPAAHRIAVLAEEFARAGHDVFVRGRGSPLPDAPPDVVHVFGWDALAAVGVRGEAAAVASLDPGGAAVDHTTVALGQAYDRVIAGSSSAARELLAFGVRRDRLGVVPDGVDTGFYNAGPAGPGLREGGGTPKIVCVRAQLNGAALMDTILALRRVPDARLYVAGGPPAQQIRRDTGAREVAELAHRLGVSGRIFLLGGVPQRAMPDLYRSADIVVCTGEPEAPRVALEAMACAVPVVAFAGGPVADIIVHNVSGVLVDPGKATALGDATRVLLTSEPRRYAYAVAGLSRVQERFTWPKVAEQIEAYYRAALADRQDRAAVVDG
jgi:glycosyltransferase involved in cell wall biosynthesis